MFASWNSSSWTTKEEPLFVFLFEEWFTRNYRKQRFLWFVPIRKNHLFERTILQEPQEFQARRNGSFALLLVSRRTAFFSSSPFLFFFLNPTVSFLFLKRTSGVLLFFFLKNGFSCSERSGSSCSGVQQKNTTGSSSKQTSEPLF